MDKLFEKFPGVLPERGPEEDESELGLSNSMDVDSENFSPTVPEREAEQFISPPELKKTATAVPKAFEPMELGTPPDPVRRRPKSLGGDSPTAKMASNQVAETAAESAQSAALHGIHHLPIIGAISAIGFNTPDEVSFKVINTPASFLSLSKIPATCFLENPVNKFRVI